MKRFFLLIFVILFLITSILALFLFLSYKQFDNEDLRTVLKQGLEKKISGEVELDAVKLVWGVEPHFSIGSFELALSRDQEVFVQASQIKIPLQVKSWRRRKLLLGPMSVQKAKVNLLRDKEGLWSWKRLEEPPRLHSAAAKGEGSFLREFFSPYAWAFSLRTIEVRELEVLFRDESGAETLSHTLKDCMLRLDHPTSFSSWRYRVVCPDPGAFKLSGSYDVKQHRASFELSSWNDRFTFRGDLLDLGSFPRLRGVIETHGLALKSSVLSTVKKESEVSSAVEEITGSLTAKFQGVADGTHPEKIRETLSAGGPIDIRAGFFKKYNFVKKILRKVYDTSEIEMMDAEQVPNKFHDILIAEDLPFDILQARIRVHNSRVYLSDIRVKHAHYFLEAEGSFGWLDQDAEFSAKLILYEELTDYLSSEVPLVAAFKGEPNRIVIPFNFRGLMPQASVYPDLSLVVSRIKKMLDAKESARVGEGDDVTVRRAPPLEYEEVLKALGPRVGQEVNLEEGEDPVDES